MKTTKSSKIFKITSKHLNSSQRKLIMMFLGMKNGFMLGFAWICSVMTYLIRKKRRRLNFVNFVIFEVLILTNKELIHHRAKL